VVLPLGGFGDLGDRCALLPAEEAEDDSRLRILPGSDGLASLAAAFVAFGCFGAFVLAACTVFLVSVFVVFPSVFFVIFFVIVASFKVRSCTYITPDGRDCEAN
jgi:hypothetical protein